MIKTQHCPNCEATEQRLHDFQQKVSDIVKAYSSVNYDEEAWENLTSLIISAPKPDPLVEVINDADDMVRKPDAPSYAEAIRAALKARGLEIREKNDD